MRLRKTIRKAIRNRIDLDAEFWHDALDLALFLIDAREDGIDASERAEVLKRLSALYAQLKAEGKQDDPS